MFGLYGPYLYWWKMHVRSNVDWCTKLIVSNNDNNMLYINSDAIHLTYTNKSECFLFSALKFD